MFVSSAAVLRFSLTLLLLKPAAKRVLQHVFLKEIFAVVSDFYILNKGLAFVVLQVVFCCVAHR